MLPTVGMIVKSLVSKQENSWKDSRVVPEGSIGYIGSIKITPIKKEGERGYGYNCFMITMIDGKRCSIRCSYKWNELTLNLTNEQAQTVKLPKSISKHMSNNEIVAMYGQYK